ncbi:GPI-anchored small secreted protein [Mycena leptocephala]|nr:GPI-anchored small secreted protein [Mycena leptocephala]
MFPSLAVVAAFAVASVSAIAVTSPSASKGWTNDGSQIVSWSSVVSDPGNFTILLVNDKNPSIQQVLDALVQTDKKTTTVNPPAQGWPAIGNDYRVNLVASSEELSTILAQSDQFNITAAPVQSSSSTTSQTLATTPATTPTTGTDGAATPTDGSGSSGSPTDGAPANTGTSAALPAMGVHTSLVGTLVLLSAILAQF